MELKYYKERAHRPLSIKAFEEDAHLRRVFASLCYFQTPTELSKFLAVCNAFFPLDRMSYYEGVATVD